MAAPDEFDGAAWLAGLPSPPRTPFIGRGAELARLAAALSREAGEAGLVVVQGESGIGKSRLIRQALSARIPDSDRPLVLQCSRFATTSPFQPVRDALARTAGVLAADTPEERRGRIEALLVRTVGGSTTARMALIATLLEGEAAEDGTGTPPPPGQRSELMRLLADMLAQLAAAHAVIVIEDAQWLDPSTGELLQALLPRLAAEGIALVVSALPGPLPAWLAPPAAEAITLPRLPAEETAALVAAIAGDASLPPEQAMEIVARTQGLPLLAEELVQGCLAAAPGAARQVPETLDEALGARLDRLALGRRIAPLAAAIGRSFPLAVLGELTGMVPHATRKAVAELVAAGILTPSSSPFGAAVRFRQAMEREAAYRLLPAEQAPALHARIADLLEKQFRSIARGQPQMMAMQRQAAGQPDKAAIEWSRAGRGAVRRSAYAEALGFFRHALEALAATPATPARDEAELDLRLNLMGALVCASGYLAEAVSAETEQVVALAERLGGRSRVMPALQARWVQLGATNHVRASRDFARHALAATAHDAVLDRLIAHRMCGTSSLFYGDLADALRHYRAFVALFDAREHAEAMRTGHSDHAAMVMLGIAEVHTLRGEATEGDEWRERTLDWTRRSGRVHDECHVLSFAILHACVQRRDEEAREQTRRLERLTSVHALPNWAGFRDLYDGVLRCRGGDHAALAVSRRGVESLLAARLFGSWWYLLHAEACVGAGAWQDAEALFVQVRPIMELGDVRFGAEFHRLVARMLKERDGDAEAAARELVTGLELADRQGAALMRGHLVADLSNLPPEALPPEAAGLMRGSAHARASPRRWTGGRVV